MSDTGAKSGKRTLLLAAGFAIVIAVVVVVTRPDGKPKVWEIDASGLKPGGELAFEIGKRPVVLSVPEKDGATIGSFMISSPAVGFHSGPIERNGSLETIWVDDVTGDGREDAVLLVRSGGSGRGVDLFVLERTPAGFAMRDLRDLPDLPDRPDLPVVGKGGPMGHDHVTVRDGVIQWSFSSDDETGESRVNRQWTAKDGAEGKSPVRKADDSKAAPSGKTMRFSYEYGAGVWKPVTE